MIQIVLPSLEGEPSETRISQVIAGINNKYGTINYNPVVYLCQDVNYFDYLALLSIANVCLICSLQEGMNLISYEYGHIFLFIVICQEETKNPLIISEVCTFNYSLLETMEVLGLH